MSRAIDAEAHKEIQAAIIDRMRTLGIDIDGRDYALVLLLVEPVDTGGDRLHVGSYNLGDEAVLEVLRLAPQSVVAQAMARQAEAKARGQA